MLLPFPFIAVGTETGLKLIGGGLVIIGCNGGEAEAGAFSVTGGKAWGVLAEPKKAIG